MLASLTSALFVPLYPVVKELKLQGERVKLVRDRLFVNGQLYTGNVDSASENTSVKKPYTPGPSQNYHTSGAHTSGAHSVTGAAASGPKDSKAKSYAAAAKGPPTVPPNETPQPGSPRMDTDPPRTPPPSGSS